MSGSLVNSPNLMSGITDNGFQEGEAKLTLRTWEGIRCVKFRGHTLMIDSCQVN